MPPIRVENFGEGGVNVDKSHLQTEDNETRESQNATYDTTRERLGGLSKRPGLGRFNTVSLTDPVLGGCEAPYTGVATATGGGGGGLPGDSGGTGQVTLAPGVGGIAGTAPGDDVTFGAGGTLLQSSVTTGGIGGAKLFSGRRLILVGRVRNAGGVSNDNGAGWYLTSEQFQDPAWIIGSDGPEAIAGAGPPGACRQSVGGDGGTGLRFMQAAPAASAIFDGWLYYAKNMVTTSGTPATDVRGEIRRTNGYIDETVARIERNPWNTDTTQANRVVSMLVANNGIYLCTCDKGQTPTGESASTNPDWGRVFYLRLVPNYDPNDIRSAQSGTFGVNVLTEVNVDNPGAEAGWARTPFSLAYYLDRVFFGGYQSDGAENDATINYPQTDAAPVLDLKQDTPYFRTTCMAVYNGELFAGYQMRDTGAGVIDFAQVWGRVAAHATPGANPWTTRLTASGGTAVAENAFVSMVVFKSNLYVSYFNFTQAAKIYKYDGTSWTTQYSITNLGSAADRAPLYLFVDTNSAGTEILYAFGWSESSVMSWLSSTDGTTFTNRTTTMHTVTVHSTSTLFTQSTALPVFFGFDQK